jgi:hypothetical protein
MSFGEDPELAMARDYFSGNADEQRLKEIKTLLEIHGITDEQIRAKAMEICGGAFRCSTHGSSSCATSLHRRVAVALTPLSWSTFLKFVRRLVGCFRVAGKCQIQ